MEKESVVEYEITDNQFDLEPSDIFEIGMRNNNPKRSFFFVNKLLGRHLSVNPEVVRSTGYLLSAIKFGFDYTPYLKCIKDGIAPKYVRHIFGHKTLVIGLCEAATGLGAAVASSLMYADYVSTTREPLVNVPELLRFEEEHSHAPTHRIIMTEEALKEYDYVIIVDDEITTGRTILNLIKQIEFVKHMRDYMVMSILDWSDSMYANARAAFCKTHGVEIHNYSVLKGRILNSVSNVVYKNIELTVKNDLVSGEWLKSSAQKDYETKFGIRHYSALNGMTLVNSVQLQEIELAAMVAAIKIRKRCNAESYFVLGNGENVYFASRVAAYLQASGARVAFKTTTRSPLYCDGKLIKDVITYKCGDADYYFYNTDEFGKYDEVIMLSDSVMVPELCDNYRLFYL